MRRNTRVVVQPRRGPGLMGTMARTAVIAGTATAVSGATANKMHQSAQAQQAQMAAAPVEAAPSAAELRIMKLKELGALRDAGILTEEEFQSEKTRVLAG